VAITKSAAAYVMANSGPLSDLHKSPHPLDLENYFIHTRFT
jgi:hypothetical protein